MSTDTKIRLIELLKKHGKVLITSEDKIDQQFEKHQLKISPERIHDLLHYAQLFVGDSQSMTIEAALLGTPSIRCNDFVGKCPVIEELEHKYGLTYGFKSDKEERMFSKIEELLQNRDLKREWQEKREELLQDKIDLTEWMVGFVEKNEM